jgi:hypothetical protein
MQPLGKNEGQALNIRNLARRASMTVEQRTTLM